ncbi:FMN-dependent NADH-azoreductase [Shimazuella alba]|uniref:FMN dependent NADH:quinone oxidoreductase n=1 Tax=Shimazuella alba TaxID=2690964 RepID=A0A6I4VZA1_9BACL|nr:FMN-dependent NADH-azoreductase [Shimazuella alba]MXQ55076.1 FMN-dependent NADH-azoreductase [Shimazuella alba]
MAKVLYITANPKPVAESFSLRTGQAFLEEYKKASPQDEVVHLDLYKLDIPMIDADVFNGWGKLANGKDLTSDEKAKVERIAEITDEFVSADKYVFVTPFWNFFFPPKLKAYIDAICIAGKTFKYTENGSVGLLGEKRVVHIQARGGFYSEGPTKELEFGDRYLRTVFGFLGVTDIQTVVAEGMAYDPSKAEGIVAKAIEKAREVAKNFAGEMIHV